MPILPVIDDRPTVVTARPVSESNGATDSRSVVSSAAISADRKPLSLALQALAPYAAIARPDHWFKNVFMLFGVLLACFYYSTGLSVDLAWTVGWGLVATCMLASSNYVLNEILDSATDCAHPTKCARPIPSGRVSLPLAYSLWISLGAAGLALAYAVNLPFLIASAILLFMGVVYNVPPWRAKDVPFVDVLVESVNNPLRLLLGWYTVHSTNVPPLSLLIFYWMIGSFFMASKRFAEYRTIGDRERAAAYRKSFRLYTEDKLLISMFCYATAAALFLGIFIVRYKLELILAIPLIAGFFGYYLAVSLKKHSPVQNPEHLYRERGLMAYLALMVSVLVALMFVGIPALYDLFNVSQSGVPSLWEL